MPTDFASTTMLLARLLIGGGFLHAAVFNVPAFDRLTGFLASRGVPAPRLSLIAATAIQAVAAVAMILGLWVGWAALALAAFTIVSTPVFHNFWDFQGEERRLKGIPFRSNVIVLGGLAALLATAGL